MAHKRKAVDFYYTLSDEEDTPAPTSKRNKTTQPNLDEEDDVLASDFEFGDGGLDFVDKSIGAQDMEWAGGKTGINLNEMIKKKRETKQSKTRRLPEAAEEESGEAVASDAELDLDDGDDEVLAADGFGMGVASDVEESEAEGDAQDDGDEPASDNDSVATPVAHPDDKILDSSDEDEVDEVDEEELKKERAFFAPEPKQKKGKSGPSTFMALGLSRPILMGVTAAGFDKPTPIQAKTIPFALEGKDVVGQAVTGSGKTAAFLLPILERLFYGRTKVPVTRVVILTPTRELAIQCHTVAQTLARSTGVALALTVGGTSLKASEKDLRSRPDIVIATPGRFIDHMRNSVFAVDRVEILVLDEADRMLQEGFADELNEIVTTLPKRRQTMLFSATMNSSVDQLIRVGMTKPVRILADPQKKSVETLAHEFVRLRPGREAKRMGYLVHLCKFVFTERVIVFFREKRHIHRTRIIFGLLGLSCAELHGDIKQAERVQGLDSFRRGTVRFLLASDLASRGLDIKGVETVINYETPKNDEDYIHRVGRTARAGRHGTAVTFVTENERKFVKKLAKLMEGNAKLKSRVIDAAVADRCQVEVDNLEEDVEELLKEEKTAKELAQMEMAVTKGENLVKHHDEIMARPKRTWFETEAPEKKPLDKTERVQRLRDKLKKKRWSGKLSNKDEKKLDAYADRVAKEAPRKRKTKGGKK